jgi:hypothetical protein
MRRLKLCFLFLLFPIALLASNQSWQLFKSTHFFIFYRSASDNELNTLSQKAEECYNNIADDLGLNRFNFWTWDNRAKIYLYDNKEEYLKETNSADWSIGQATTRNKTIQTFLTAPEFLDNILPHEMAHIIFMEMVGSNNPAVPLWLEEGAASYHEKEIASVKADLAQRIKQGDFINLDTLSRFKVLSSEDPEKVKLFYAESYSLVKYLISEFGQDKFVFFCQELRDNRNFTAALSRAYSFGNLQDFESSWKSYILK